MVWLHPLLLSGLFLVAVPVVLHLMMRAKPKKLIFPALRLIQNRRRTNVRRLRLRHWLLLALRMAVIAALVLAVARPSVPAADYSLSGGDWIRLLLLGAAAGGCYLGLLSWWRRQQLAPHEMAYRKSYLRAGLGLASLVAFLLLVAWPYQKRIAAAITQPTIASNEFLPVAAVMLFDTSLSMQYRHESHTRLEMAQQVASRHIASLPRQSRVAVCDTLAESPIRLQTDLSTAAKRISGLGISPLSKPLEDRLLAAIEVQIEDHERLATGEGGATANEALLREIYVFTDLAASAWRREESPRLKEALLRLPSLGIYLIDVGVSAPTNVGITGLTLAEQSVAKGNDLNLRFVLEAAGIEPGERIVELHAENETGRMVKKGQQSIKVDSSSAATAQFSLPAVGGPVLQGELRLVASDPLAFDDVRAFTALIRPPTEVLVVAESQSDASWIIDVLSPPELAALGKQKARCDYIPPSRLSTADLSRYAVVYLVNVADPKVAGWNKLVEYLDQGGDVAVILGDQVSHAGYLSPAAQNVLPGELKARLRFNPPEFLDLQNLSHPLLKRFEDWGTAGLTTIPILEYWSVTPQPRGTAIVAAYTDHRRSPALIEMAAGKGRVLMLTTSLDRRWSELPVSPWFVVLADQMLQYLAQAQDDLFNYTIGENVTIPLDRDLRLPAYLLRKPGLQQLRQEVLPGSSTATVSEVDQLGNYKLTATEPAVKFERGFSVNAPPAESQLKRFTKDELDVRLSPDRYSVARDIENLQRNVRTGRLGREAFPLLAVLLLAVFLGEHFLANRFYGEEQQSDGGQKGSGIRDQESGVRSQ